MRSYVSMLAAVLVVAFVLAATALNEDREIRADLRYVLGIASGRLSPSFAGYRMAKEYDSRETLSLIRDDLVRVVASWPHLHAAIYLQAVETQGKVYFDSRFQGVRTYSTFDPVSADVRYGSWRAGRPLLYVDEDLTGEKREILRTAISRGSYIVAQFKGLLWALPALVAIGIVVHILREVIRRRRFGLLVDAMTKIVRHNETVERLVHELPPVIGKILGLDAVAIYLREGDRIVPRACYLESGADVSIFLQSTEQEPIMIDGPYPESRAMREGHTIVVANKESLKTVHRPKFEASGSRPYIIIPLSLEGGSPIGLLTAEYSSKLLQAGLHRQHLDFMRSCAEISALLLENVRRREALERMYRQMIRTARTVTLGMVVPNIAHSMRTPLVVVNELATSIEKDFGALPRKELDERIAGIRAQTELCFEEIRSISHYRRLGASPTGSVSLRQGLDRVCGFFHGYFRIKGIELVAQTALDTNPVIGMQELDFVQVINNFLTNSDEAFSELLDAEGHPSDHRKFKIEVNVRQANGGVLISVIDNGPGIPPKVLPRIFEQDFTTKADGTGAGLPYCRHVVKEAGGWIKVESTPGGGATFTIFLPVREG
jgi:signal transduction histidine kinase